MFRVLRFYGVFYHNMNVKNDVFLERELRKHIARHIDASSVRGIWTLVDNGKLTNRIARLTAIAIKKNKVSRARFV